MGRETGAAVALLRTLAPTPAENARFAREYLVLLGRLVVAGRGGGATPRRPWSGVDEAGLLAPETVRRGGRAGTRASWGRMTDYRWPGSSAGCRWARRSTAAR